MRYDYQQYLSYMALILRLKGEDARNYIQSQLDAHPELSGKKLSWDQWKREHSE